MNTKAILYLVPTPIGNLQDMTFRAIQTLKDVTLILAEDTRTSGFLLKHYEIRTPMQSYHKHNERKRCSEIIERLKKGDSIALISDAGTPVISDPGELLVKEVIANDFEVICLPGATAFVPALVASGLCSSKFSFHGFLPEKLKDKTAIMENIKENSETLIFYISPHNISSELEFFLNHIGNRKAVLAKEISKFHETFYRGTLESLMKDDTMNRKGEFVLIIEGFVQKQANSLDAEQMLIKLLSEGLSGKDAVTETVSALKLRKNIVYDIYTKLKKA